MRSHLYSHTHFRGYAQARDVLLHDHDKASLLATLDALYGRGELSIESELEVIRAEALRQQEMDWRIESKDFSKGA